MLVQQTQSSAELTVHLTLSRTESGLATYETVSDCKRECGYDNIETNRKLSSVSEGCSDIQERAPENTVLVSGEKGIQQPLALCDKKEENKDHVYAVVHKERKGRASSEVSALEKTAGRPQEETSGLPVQWASYVDQSPSLTPENGSSHQTNSGLDNNTEAAGSETPQAGGNTEYLYAALDMTKNKDHVYAVLHKERKGRVSSEVSALEKTAGRPQEETSGLPVQWASYVDQSPSLTPENGSSHQTNSGLDNNTEAAGSETPQAGGNTEYLYAALDMTKNKDHVYAVLHKERKGRVSSEVSALEKTAGRPQEETSGLPVQWASYVDQSPSLTPENGSSHQTNSGLDNNTEAARSETPQAGGNTEYLYAALNMTKKKKKPLQVIHLTNPDQSFFFVSFCFVLLLFVGIFFT